MKTHLLYSLHSAADFGIDCHAQTEMLRLREKYHFKIFACRPESMADSWRFWVESTDPIEWPSYICEMSYVEPSKSDEIIDSKLPAYDQGE